MEAASLCGYVIASDARRLLQALERRGLLERNWKVKKGPMRFTKGRYFAQWRECLVPSFRLATASRCRFRYPR